MIDIGVDSLTWDMEIAAARAIARSAEDAGDFDSILPAVTASDVASSVAEAVRAETAATTRGGSQPRHAEALKAIPTR